VGMVGVDPPAGATQCRDRGAKAPPIAAAAMPAMTSVSVLLSTSAIQSVASSTHQAIAAPRRPRLASLVLESFVLGSSDIVDRAGAFRDSWRLQYWAGCHLVASGVKLSR